MHTFKYSGLKWVLIYLIIIKKICDLIYIECVHLSNNSVVAVNYNFKYNSSQDMNYFGSFKRILSDKKTKNIINRLESTMPPYLWTDIEQMHNFFLMGLNLNKFPDMKKVKIYLIF